MNKKILLLTMVFAVGGYTFMSNMLFAKKASNIRNRDKKNIDKIISKGNRLKQDIRNQYKKIFKSITGKIPFAKLAPPIEIKNTKMIRSHNATPGTKELPKAYAYVRAKYQLRDRMSSQGRKLVTVKKNEKVEVKMMIRKRGNSVDNYTWHFIATKKGKEGFIPNVYLSQRPVRQKDKIKKIKIKVMFVNALSGLNMRSRPNTKAKKIALIPHKTKVRMFARSRKKEKIGSDKDYWYKVEYYNKKGWVFGAFLKKKIKIETIVSGGKYQIPIKGRISSKFGYRIDPLTKRRGSFHTGLDIVAPRGTPIKSAQGGTVFLARWYGGYGKLVILKHKNNFFTYYAHQSKLRVRKGQSVRKGFHIGDVGTTGRSTGPHLHFEVRRGKAAVNPNKFMKF